MGLGLGRVSVFGDGCQESGELVLGEEWEWRCVGVCECILVDILYEVCVFQLRIDVLL